MRRAYDYYEAAQQGLGHQFVEYFVEALEAIASHGDSFNVLYKHARRVIVRKFPYGVFFRDRESHWDIFAVLDLRQNPRRWQRRA